MVWSLAAQVVRQVLSVISVSVLARLLVPADYGVLAMAATVTNIFDNFKDLGLSLIHI